MAIFYKPSDILGPYSSAAKRTLILLYAAFLAYFLFLFLCLYTGYLIYLDSFYIWNNLIVIVLCFLWHYVERISRFNIIPHFAFIKYSTFIRIRESCAGKSLRAPEALLLAGASSSAGPWRLAGGFDVELSPNAMNVCTYIENVARLIQCTHTHTHRQTDRGINIQLADCLIICAKKKKTHTTAARLALRSLQKQYKLKSIRALGEATQPDPIPSPGHRVKVMFI